MRIKAFLALIGAACVVAAIAGGASGATGPSCQTGSGQAGPGGVVIQLQDSSKFCSAAVIQSAEDLTSPTQYTVCGPLGKACHTVTVNAGISIKRLLHIAGVPGVQLAEAIPARGSPSILLQSGGFAGGFVALDPPLGYVGPTGTSSNLELINAPGAAPIKIHAYTRVLNVTVASTGASSTYRPGTRVQFSASPAPGSGVSYIWSSPAGKTVTHTNSITLTVNDQGANGNFDVYVTVVGPNGAGVSPTPAQITVHGTPPKNAVNPPGLNNGKKKSGSGGTGLTGNTSTTPTTTYPTTTYPSYTSPNYTSPGTTNNSGQQAHKAKSHSPPITTVGPGQKIVEGRLISNVTPVAPSALASGSGSGGTGITTSQRPTQSTPLVTRALPPAAGFAVAGGILLLLVSGAGRELRSVRRSIASARLA
jgi:hypothetical protein